jgi:cephalosporin hydroxylase
MAPRTFDLVYIDASHLEENVVADLEAWYPKVRAGGLLCGHDWGYYEGVEKAVHRFLTNHPQCVHKYLTADPNKIASFGLQVAF